MKTAILSAVAVAAIAGSASAQVKWFKWDGQVAIPDLLVTTAPNTTFASVFIDVPNSGIIADMDVDLIIAHTWQGDLKIDLIAPGGQTVTLLDRAGTTSTFGTPFGFSTDNFGNPATGAKFIFDDEAASVYDTGGIGVGTGLNNPAGSWKPQNLLAAFDNRDKAGRWELRVTDQGGGDTGSIRNFGLHFTQVPAPGAVAMFGLAGLAAARRRR